MMASRAARATVSPPRWEVVAGAMPSSASVGGEKSLLGPRREVYEESGEIRWEALKSGSADGGDWTKERDVEPGSGREVGDGSGRGIGGSFFAAWCCYQHSLVVTAASNGRNVDVHFEPD